MTEVKEVERIWRYRLHKDGISVTREVTDKTDKIEITSDISGMEIRGYFYFNADRLPALRRALQEIESVHGPEEAGSKATHENTSSK